MMKRALLLVLLPACGWFVEANPSYCERDSDCADPAQPFCDVQGAYADLVRNRCVANPMDAGPSCDESNDCTVPAAPICGPTGQCEPCDEGSDGDQACFDKDQTRPICLAGACVAGCSGSGDCPASEPICAEDLHCAKCDHDSSGDDDCYARNPDLGHCTDAGTCVACLDDDDCEGVTPICEVDPGTCRACESHAECDSEVCNLDSGACESTVGIIYVAGDGTDGASCGGQLNPCRSIGETNGGLAKIDVSHPILRIRAGLYNESVEVLTAKTVVMVGPGVTISPPGSSNSPAMRVGGGGQVTVREATLSNATGNSDADGVQCTGSSSALVLWKVTVSGNQATGVQVSDCGVTITRSLISGNVGGGISISNADFRIVNSIIVGNGNIAQSVFGGVTISNGSGFTTQIFDFNTVARNQALGGADSSGVDCFTGTAMTARNNIVYRGLVTAPTISGSCDWAYSNIQDLAEEIDGNIDEPPLFKDEVGGNFHLQAGSLCRDKADPAATLLEDYDGQLRPEGEYRDMGADEYHPE